MRSLWLDKKFNEWFYSTLHLYHKTDEQKVLLTFDDGPEPDLTEKIINILTEWNVSAFFFLLVKKIKQFDYDLSIYTQNNQKFGLHGYDHFPVNINFNVQNWEEALEWIEMYAPVEYVRPPFGILGKEFLKFCDAHQKKIMMWTITTYDYKKPDIYTWAKKIGNIAQKGDILLLHDSIFTKDFYPDALQYLLEELKKRKVI